MGSLFFASRHCSPALIITLIVSSGSSSPPQIQRGCADGCLQYGRPALWSLPKAPAIRLSWHRCFVEGRLLRAQAAQFVALCLCKDADRRPSAAALLKHAFLRQARDRRWLAQRLLGPARATTGRPRDSISHARRTVSAKEASAQVRCTQPERLPSAPLSG